MVEEKICKACSFNNLPFAHFCTECGSNLNLSNYDNLKTLSNLSTDSIKKVELLINSIEELEDIGTELEQQSMFVNSLISQLDQVKNRENELHDILYSEEKDVKKLENFSLTSLFAKIKGEYDTKFEKELAERAIAQEKYDMAVKDTDELEKQLNTAIDQKNEFLKLEKEYRRLVGDLDTTLNNLFEGVSHPEEDELEQLKGEYAASMNSTKVELDRNLIAQNHLINAKSMLRRAYDKLSSAGDYANWDSFFDGGIIADSMKHSRWDEARNYMRQANRQIQSAKSVYPNMPGIYVNDRKDGSDFFDVWMDNIFSDFRARDQIRQSRDEVNWAINRLSDIINSLATSGRNIQDQYDKLRINYKTTHQKLREKRLELVKSQTKNTKSQNKAKAIK